MFGGGVICRFKVDPLAIRGPPGKELVDVFALEMRDREEERELYPGLDNGPGVR